MKQNEHPSFLDYVVPILNPQFFLCPLQATRTKIPRIPAIALTRAAGHAKESVSNVTRLAQAVEGVLSEDSPARAMRFVYAGAQGSHREADSVVPTNLFKSLYRRHPREDGTSGRRAREAAKMSKVNRYCCCDRPRVMVSGLYSPSRTFKVTLLKPVHCIR